MKLKQNNNNEYILTSVDEEGNIELLSDVNENSLILDLVDEEGNVKTLFTNNSSEE